MSLKMYGYLADAIAAGHVVTASRRLARSLRDAYADQQIRQGHDAWASPQIFSWHAWLRQLGDATGPGASTVTRINSNHSRVLWERCIARELGDSLVNIGSLARIARETWERIGAWNVDIEECAEAARGQDQQLFARAATRYSSMLDDKRWIDDAATARWLASLIESEAISLPGRVTFSGFDRISPQFQGVIDALAARGIEVRIITHESHDNASLCRCETPESELRMAGAWARARLDANPAARIAIIVNKLEQDAERFAGLVREGFVPGWQLAGTDHRASVNVALAKSLSSYPAIHDALLILRWLFEDLGSADVSLLLRSRFIAQDLTPGRARLELLLRNMPDRQWSMQRALNALSGREESADATDWLDRMGAFRESIDCGEQLRAPIEWAEAVNRALIELGWPGSHNLSSDDFQLVERWRELLNDFSRLELVASRLNGLEAVSRISALANEAVFQPENANASLHVMGPADAAGMQFDHVWIAGMGANDWPPTSRPLPLVSRDLQRDKGMPDGDPVETAQFAERVLQRLQSCAPECILSYAVAHAEEEQLPTARIAGLEPADSVGDPGWYASRMAASADVETPADPVPAIAEDEVIVGGSSTINRQVSDPFGGFAFGRLAVRWLQPFTPGIAANVRGNILHDVLRNLYEGKPDRQEIRSWSEPDIDKRIDDAVNRSFSRYERHADTRLSQLFALERRRASQLASRVVQLDRDRDDFSISMIEETLDTRIGDIRLRLKSDRIDRLPSGEIVILDYKTGATKKFLRSGEPVDLQLVVYACIAESPVAGLGLYNVDSKAVSINGAGPAINDEDNWDELLGAWMQDVHDACASLARGDLGLNRLQALSDARVLAPLSRYPEITLER